MGLSPSSLSHTIRSLEERTGAKLLNRTTRSVSPTEAGQLLFDRVAPAFGEIAGAMTAVGEFRARPAGIVRINVPSAAAQIVLAPVLGRFTQSYPDIRLEVTMEDTLVDIVEGGFDIGIRPGELLQRDMIAARLTPDLRMAAVCSPDYLASRSTPLTPHELRHHACLMYRWKGNNQIFPWPLKRDGEAVGIHVDGVISSNDIGVIVSACLGGAGIAYLAEQLVISYLDDGRLVRLLDDWCEPFPGFFLYYPSRQMSAAVRAFVEFMREPG